MAESMNAPIAAGRPPSPPHSDDGDAGVAKLKTQVSQSEPYTPPRSVKPAPRYDAADYSNFEVNKSHVDVSRSLPIQDTYGDPSLYQTAPTQNYYPVQQPTFVRTTQLRAHTPPQVIHSDTIRTRSGRALGSPLSPGTSQAARASRSPRVKKATKAGKSGKNRAPVVDEPLSISTRNYKIAVKDMGAWVHRPVETRMEEVEKKKGHISRPMNSFMLYRSAYADRVKQFCKENNHQVVSQVTGASWPLEPKEVREMYETYANIERDNHQAAFPHYKFAPNKPGRKRAYEEDDEVSDNDPDWEDSSKGKRTRAGTSRSRTNTPYEAEQSSQQPLRYSHLPPHPSSYQATNPYGQSPATVGPAGHQRYYEARVIPYGQQIDDVTIRRVDNPFPPRYGQSGSLVALPSGGRNGIQPGYISGPTQQQVQYNVIDPGLQQNLNTQYYTQYVPQNFENEYQEVFERPMKFEYGTYEDPQMYNYPAASFHPGQATLTDGHNLWAEDGQVNDFDLEFQKFD